MPFILWLYSISICDGSRSWQKKTNETKKKSKVNKKLSQQPTTHYQFAPLSHVMAFFFSHGAAPLLLLLYYYRFVPLRYYILFYFFFFLFSIKIMLDFLKS
jgi:hypothetical protein